MIIHKPSELPNIPKDEAIVCDVETTSFDDNVEAFNPFQGHRILGVAFGILNGKEQWYMPVRHSHNPEDNFPMEAYKQWFPEFMQTGRTVVGHNVKFDARFWHFDGVTVTGKLLCTMVMARVWKSDLPSLTLDYLSGGGKDKTVKKLVKKMKTKDYGRVPIPIMGPYAEKDIIETRKLYHVFNKAINSSSRPVLETEFALTKELLKAEIRGLRIDVLGLKKTYMAMLRRMLDLQNQIDEYADTEVDCLSNLDLTEALVNRMGFKVQSISKKGNIEWNRGSLTQLDHPIGKLIMEFKHMSWFTSTFCKGWLKRIDSEDRLHPNFHQGSAVTGRMASRDPCTTNLPEEAELFILPDDGCVILGMDYSQIEYRIFAHYSNDPKILKEYLENPNADYHQMLADLLGVPRQFAKMLNFAFLYGMGKDALLHTIAALLAITDRESETYAKMMDLGFKSGAHFFAKRAQDLGYKEFKIIASSIYDMYHARVPSIRALNQRVTEAIRGRGWLKNYMGRIYNTPYSSAYKGVNLLIQGSAADIFKNRLLATLKALPNCGMITNVYDAVYFNVPKDAILESYRGMKTTLEDMSGFEMRVPLVTSPTIGAVNLVTCQKFKKESEIFTALEKSKTIKKDFIKRGISSEFYISA